MHNFGGFDQILSLVEVKTWDVKFSKSQGRFLSSFSLFLLNGQEILSALRNSGLTFSRVDFPEQMQFLFIF
jgi:hypothetical protein